jgi:hypothetical protein
MKKTIQSIFVWLIVILVVWIFISQVVFSLRHPWATDTEKFLHFFDAMAFKKIEYSEMRER